jgi:hypothetical protein
MNVITTFHMTVPCNKLTMAHGTIVEAEYPTPTYNPMTVHDKPEFQIGNCGSGSHLLSPSDTCIRQHAWVSTPQSPPNIHKYGAM